MGLLVQAIRQKQLVSETSKRRKCYNVVSGRSECRKSAQHVPFQTRYLKAL